MGRQINRRVFLRNAGYPVLGMIGQIKTRKLFAEGYLEFVRKTDQQ